MKREEFKAWFEGYTENMDGPPGAKQWDRIKARVKEIDGTSVIYSPVYVDRWRYWNPYGSTLTYYSNACESGTVSHVNALPNTSGVVTMLASMGREDAAADA